jgi:hypothetical protein
LERERDERNRKEDRGKKPSKTQTKKKNWGNWTEKEKKKQELNPDEKPETGEKNRGEKNREPARKNPKQRKNKRTTQEHTREPKQSFGRSSITPPSPESESKPGEQKNEEEPENKKASPPADQVSSSSSPLFILIHRLLFTLNFNSHILTHFLYSAHARVKSLHACFL